LNAGYKPWTRSYQALIVLVQHHPTSKSKYPRRKSSDPGANQTTPALRATPPDSGGELINEFPSSDEEGWRSERRGGWIPPEVVGFPPTWSVPRRRD